VERSRFPAWWNCGTAFTPIINAPEVAILGVSKSAQKPVYEQGAFVPRLMLPLSLSYDHRVIDAPKPRASWSFSPDIGQCEGAAVSLVEVRVPDLGDSKGVNVVDVLVEVGAQVRIEDPLITLESEKASMDVPSPVNGVVSTVEVKKGSQVSTGTLIVTVQTADAKAAPTQSAAAPATAAPAKPAPEAGAPRLLRHRRRPRRRPRAEVSAGTALRSTAGAWISCARRRPGGYTAAFRAADLGSR